MTSFFNKRFEEEFLLSEKLRTRILAAMFLFGTIYAAIVSTFFGSSIPDDLKTGATKRMFIFLLSLFLFEVLCLAYINSHIKRNISRIPPFSQYLNAAIEITAPGIIMLLLPRQVSALKIIHSPAMYLYFLFIILSTLRLDFKISIFMGFLAAIEFLMVSHILISRTTGLDQLVIKSEYFATSGKAFFLCLCGIGAAFVARQIKKGVNRSLSAADHGNKIISMFGQQVSKEVVEEMMNRGGDVPTKMMRVCIMFIDIRNFTTYVSQKTATEIVAYQNSFFEIIVRSVIKHKGIINQFLGDGCMVTFGAPVALENPGQNAINAALEIRRELSQAIAQGKIPLTNIGMGIHEGEAVTGNIGPVERQQYSITGSVVILAARIEQLNKEYNSQILVSENVMAKARSGISFASEYMGKVNLKGWNDAIGIYKVA